MKEVEQFPGRSVLDHGMDVHAWFLDLYLHLTQGTPLHLNWRLPDWIHDPEIIKSLLPFEILRTYQIYHDCGKPFCRTEDADGKQHFPNHAEVSYETWMRDAEGQEDWQIGELIRMDMLAHTVKGEAIDPFLLHPEAASLILTGLAEIHSNASYLNALDSDSFKIKFKQLDRLGKKLIAKIRLTAVVL